MSERLAAESVAELVGQNLENPACLSTTPRETVTHHF